MAKSYADRVGYLVIIGCFIALLFINGASADQTNCSDQTTPVLFNYTIEAKNISSDGTVVSYANCSISISGGIINGSRMISNGDGTYYCPISTTFSTGLYSTNITCLESGTLSANMRGNFEVVPDDVPLSIIVFLVGISFLFVFYSLKLETNYGAIKLLFFLTSFLVYFMIFFILFPIITEEGASSGIIDLAETVYIAYTWLFFAIAAYAMVGVLLHVMNMLIERKRERNKKGVVFD